MGRAECATSSCPFAAVTCGQAGTIVSIPAMTQTRVSPQGHGFATYGGSPLPPAYLSQVLGDATPAVGVRDLSVLQVHDPLAHILVEQDGPVMTSCGGTVANR